MEECNNNNNDNRKRVRDDSEADSPESKVSRVNSPESKVSRVNSPESQLIRVNSGESRVESDGHELVRVEPGDSVTDSPGVNEIHDDLLNILDDTDNVTERDPTLQGLDSVIKSFEEEILAPAPDPNPVPESGEFNPNLGYLLEASDDDLGLPPTVAPSGEGKPESQESGRVGPEGVDLSGFLGFEDDFRSYEAFGFGNGVMADYDAGDNGGGYVTIDGLFDYAEPADILWRSESLHAM